MKKIFCFFSLLLVITLGFGCAKSKEPPEIVEAPPKPEFLKKEPVKVLPLTIHTYESYGQRNPFACLIKERVRIATLREAQAQIREAQAKSRAEEEARREASRREFMSRFTLKGLAWDGKDACALIEKDNVSYILKRGDLLDENSKPMPNISGEAIDGEGAILFSRGEKFYLSFPAPTEFSLKREE